MMELIRAWVIRKGRVTVAVEWEPRDTWIGVYWNTLYDHVSLWPDVKVDPDEMFVLVRVDVRVCILPMLPIHYRWVRR